MHSLRLESITYLAPRGLHIPADLAAWLTMLLFKAFRYSEISLVAQSKMFYSRLFMMRVLSYPRTTGTCTKLAGHAAAGQIKECTRLPMWVAELTSQCFVGVQKTEACWMSSELQLPAGRGNEAGVSSLELCS